MEEKLISVDDSHDMRLIVCVLRSVSASETCRDCISSGEAFSPRNAATGKDSLPTSGKKTCSLGAESESSGLDMSESVCL